MALTTQNGNAARRRDGQEHGGLVLAVLQGHSRLVIIEHWDEPRRDELARLPACTHNRPRVYYKQQLIVSVTSLLYTIICESCVRAHRRMVVVDNASVWKTIFHIDRRVVAEIADLERVSRRCPVLAVAVDPARVLARKRALRQSGQLDQRGVRILNRAQEQLLGSVGISAVFGEGARPGPGPEQIEMYEETHCPGNSETRSALPWAGASQGTTILWPPVDAFLLEPRSPEEAWAKMTRGRGIQLLAERGVGHNPRCASEAALSPQ